MASVAEDNIVQVWQMCENIYLQEDDLPDVCSPMMALLAPLIVTFSYCTLVMPPRLTRPLQAAAHELEGAAE